ncbi:MAG: hypothetical protein ABI551_09905 [Polyangiaceae bacterium]
MALSAAILACGHTSSSEPANADGGSGSDASCGTPGASSRCTSIVWPRLVVSFGDPIAASWSYSEQQADGTFGPNPCPQGYGESDALHCDLGFFGYPGLTEMTLQVATEEGGPAVATKKLELTPFNYCGDDIEHVVVSASDGGVPVIADPTIVSACGL